MNKSPSNIYSLPVELLNHIFSYLSPCFLQNTVRLVCRRFAAILSDEAFWKLCFMRRHVLNFNKIHYPLLPYLGLQLRNDGESKFKFGDDITWRELTARINKREILWGSTSSLSCRSAAIPHSAIVNTVKILPDSEIFVTGGRDKMLCVWNLTKFDQKSLITAEDDAHNGWVWDVAFCQQDQFFSCGWDNTIKGWSLYNGMKCFKTMHTVAPPMCMDVIPGLLVAGLLGQNVVLLDPRVAVLNSVHEYHAHTRSVTSLKISGYNIFSVSEDRSLTVFDLRSLKTLISNKTLKLDDDEIAFPRKVAAYRDLLYIGDSRGSLHIYDQKSNFKNSLLSLKVGCERPINAVIPSLEGVIVGTADAGVKMIIPSEPMQVVQHINIKGNEVTSIDFYKNNLVVSTTDLLNSVLIYSPVGCDKKINVI